MPMKTSPESGPTGNVGIQVPTVSKTYEPSYKFINSIPQDFNRLSDVLSYAGALTSYTTHEARANTSAYIDEANDKASSYARKSEKKFRDGIAILDSQNKLFSSIAATNIIQNFQSQMRDLEIQSLQEGEENGQDGHMDRMIEAHTNLSEEMVSQIMEPDLREGVRLTLNDAGLKSASRWFDQELTYKEAFATNQLEVAIHNGELLIDNGESLDSVTKGLAPVFEILPSTMPQKQHIISQAINHLANHSATNLAIKNPIRAATEIKHNPQYSVLTSAQRANINKAAEQMLEKMQSDILAAQYDMAAQRASIDGDKDQEVILAIASREYTIEHLIKDRDKIDEGTYKLRLEKIKNSNKLHLENKEQKARDAIFSKTLGNHSAESPQKQVESFLQHMINARFDKDGNEAPIDEYTINIARDAINWNAPLAPLVMHIKNALRSDDMQVNAAALNAIDMLQKDNAIILSGVDTQTMDSWNAMLGARADGQEMKSVKEIGEIAMIPISEMKLKERNNMLHGTKNTPPVLKMDDIKKNLKLLHIEEDDTDAITRYREAFSRVWLRTERDNVAHNYAIESVSNMYGYTSVNGIVNEGIMPGRPESFSNPTFESGGSHRERFTYETVKNWDKLSPKNLTLSGDTVQLLPDTSEQYNKCLIKNYHGNMAEGYYWYEHNALKPGTYFVKYKKFDFSIFDTSDFEAKKRQYEREGPPSSLHIGKKEIDAFNRLKTFSAGNSTEDMIIKSIQEDYKIELSRKTTIKEGNYLANEKGLPLIVDSNNAIKNYSLDLLRNYFSDIEQEENAAYTLY